MIDPVDTLTLILWTTFAVLCLTWAYLSYCDDHGLVAAMLRPATCTYSNKWLTDGQREATLLNYRHDDYTTYVERRRFEIFSEICDFDNEQMARYHERFIAQARTLGRVHLTNPDIRALFRIRQRYSQRGLLKE